VLNDRCGVVQIYGGLVDIASLLCCAVLCCAVLCCACPPDRPGLLESLLRKYEWFGMEERMRFFAMGLW
jgi:hypothetical protein